MLHLTLRLSLPSNFWCSWVDIETEQCYYLCNSEAILSNICLASEAANLNPPSNIPFPAPITSSVHESSKIFLTKDPSGWTCSPNPQNVLPPLRITEIPPRTPPLENVWKMTSGDRGEGGGGTAATNNAMAADGGEGGEERYGGRRDISGTKLWERRHKGVED